MNCAKTEFDGVDPEFIPYLQELNEKSLAYTGKEFKSSVPINFKDLGNTGEKGLCHHKRGFQSSAWEIFIDPVAWQLGNDNTRLALLMHEIGHCDYYKGHDDTRLAGFEDGSFPNSIMTTDELNGQVFKLLEEHYFKQFMEVE